MKKRVLSAFLALTMCLSLLPAAAWAEGEDAGDGTGAENVAAVTADGTTSNYTDIDEAFEAAVGAVGSTLKLLADVETGSAYTVESGSHTLDLNGKTLTSTIDADSFLYINGGTLTIQDSASGGAINSVHSTLRVNRGGTLKVTGGSFISAENNALIVFEGGSAQLSGGTFKSEKDTHSIWVMNSGKAADLLVSGYRYMDADDITQKSSYHTDGNGVVGATTVCEIPEGEVTYIDKNGSEQTQTGCTEITAKTDDISHGWYVLKEDVTVSLLNISEEVNVILCDGATLTVTSYLNVGQDSTLKLYWQSAGSGKLTAASIGVMGSVTAPAGGMKQTTDEGGTTTFEKCLTHVWGYTDNGNGTHKTTCALCGKDGRTEDHSFKNWKADEGGTTHTGTCDCGAMSTEAHDLSYVVTSTTHKQECSMCGYETAEAAHSFDETTGKCVCGADQDIAVEKVAVTITKPNGTTTTKNYTDLLEAFYDADEGRATKVEVKLLQDGKTYTLDSDKAYPLKFEYTNGVEVIVDLNGCTLKRSVPNSGYGILKVDKGDVTFQNGTLELDDSASAARAIKLLATGNKPTLTLEDMTVKAAQGIAIYAGDGKLNIESGTYGEIQIHSAEVKLSGGSYTEVEHLFGKYADLLAQGCIFVKQNDDGSYAYIDPSTMSNEPGKDDSIKNIKVIECQHEGGYTDGKCNRCGYVCPHASIGDGYKCATCGTQMAAKVGDRYFTTLAMAVAAANGGTVTLLADVEENITITGGTTVTIDLNEKTWKGMGTTWAGCQPVPLTVSGGSVTLKNGTLNQGGASDNANTAVTVNGGSLTVGKGMTIQGGKYDSSRVFPAITVESGSLTLTENTELIYGMKVTAENKTLASYLPEGTAFQKGTAEIANGYVQELTGNFTLTVREHTHSFGTDGKCACGVQCPHTDVDENSKCTVCQQQMVATVGSSYYSTLAAAIKAAKDHGTVELLDVAADYITLTESITIEDGTDVTIDMKYGTWTPGDKSSPVLTVNGGSVTLTGGGRLQVDTNSTASSVVLVKGGSLTIGEKTTAETMYIGADYKKDLPAIIVEDGSLTMFEGTELCVGMKVTAKNTTLADCLPEGCAFANYLDKSIVNGYVQELTVDSRLIVVSHTHSAVLDENGKYVCACGYTCSAHEFENGVCKNCGYVCPHENVTETRGEDGNTSAACDTCKARMAVKVTNGGTTTYYAQSFEFLRGEVTDTDNTLKTLLNDDTITPLSDCTVTLLMNDLLAVAFVDDGKNITLDLNGKNLIETGNGILVATNSTLTVTGKGSSSVDGHYDLPCVFNVTGGTLEFKALNFGGTFNSIRVESGKLTSARDMDGAIKIGTLEIGSADAKVSFKAGAFDKIVFGGNSGSVTLGDLLALSSSYDSATENYELVNSGRAFQKEDGTFLRYDTAIDKDNPVENVKIVNCPHDSVTGSTCDYCGMENIVAVVIVEDNNTIWNYFAKNDTPDAIKEAIGKAINVNGGWNHDVGNHRTLKLFMDCDIDTDVTLNAVNSRSAGKLIETQRIIDLNGHTITGGTLTANDLVTLTITDSSAGKGSISTPITVTGGATLNVDGVTVDSIIAAGKSDDCKSPSITLKPGTKFSSLALTGRNTTLGYSGMVFADCLEPGSYLADSNGCLNGFLCSVAADGSSTNPFTVKKIGCAVTAGEKTGSVPYHGNVPEALRPGVTMSDGSTPSLSYTWYYHTDSGTGEFPAAEANVGDTLNAFCVITARNENHSILWETAVTGYTLTVGAADLKDAAVTVNNADSLIFTPDGNGVGQTQTLDFTVTYNGKTLKLDTDYTITSGDSDRNAGKHTLTLQGIGNYIGTLEYKWTIQPRVLTGFGTFYKSYDGTTDLPDDVSFTYDGSSVTLSKYSGKDFTMTGGFDSANAGNRTVTATVTLKNPNYIFAGGETVQTFTVNDVPIYQATAPSNRQSGTLHIANNHEATYTYDVSQLLPTLESGREYGTVTYACSWSGNDSDYTVSAPAIDSNGILTLSVTAPNLKAEKTIGSVKVTVTSTNYFGFDLMVNVNAINKTVPTGAPTLSKTTLTYGDTLSTITLSGTMQDGENAVAGTFVWTTPDKVPAAGDSVSVTWKFTPTDSLRYVEVTGAATIAVNKATPTGAPKYTAITGSGKTLADAALTAEGGTFSVPGTVAWELPDTTEVAANTAYKWVFTPADDTNYNTVEGTVTLWRRSSGGGGSSTTKTKTTTNPDGSVTKTETKSDGTVIETTTNKDGSTTKTETRPDGSVKTEVKDANGSTGTVSTDKNGSTTAEAKVSDKAVSDAKKSDEAVKIPTEVTPGENSSSAPTVKIDLPKSSGETKIEIPVKDVTSGTVAIIVKADGTEEIVKGSIPTKDGIQLTVEGDVTVKIVDNAKNFTDTKGHWAEESIDFVSARGLVNGTSSTTFSPNAPTTRAQLWTILARQANADLTGGANWYEKAQAWAKASGISDGSSPNGIITRAQMVTMLWRAAGSPEVSVANTFTDVPADSYYAKAVAWAVEHGITTGVGGDKFDPNGTCTRAQIATFLHRSYQSK